MTIARQILEFARGSVIIPSYDGVALVPASALPPNHYHLTKFDLPLSGLDAWPDLQ